MAPAIGSKHIFSELEDPERRALIARFVEQTGGLALVPRTCLFAPWISDIREYPGCRRAVKTSQNCISSNQRPITPSMRQAVLQRNLRQACDVCYLEDHCQPTT